MAKEIDKIIQSKTAPKSNNVLWDDGENLKINRNGKWEDTIKTVPTNFLNNNKEAEGFINSPFGYEGGSYNEATIDATPGEWMFVLKADEYHLGHYAINGIEFNAPKSTDEIILNMGTYRIKITSIGDVYINPFYPQTITISCRTYKNKKLLSSNFIKNDSIDLTTEEGVSTLTFLLEKYGYKGLIGKIFEGDGWKIICTGSGGGGNFESFDIIGFSGSILYIVTVEGLSYPLNITVRNKQLMFSS